MTEYLYVKASCPNNSCRATFNMRLESGTPSYCEEDHTWQQAKIPCPLCDTTVIQQERRDNLWVPLADAHEHAEEASSKEKEASEDEPEKQSEEDE